MTKNKEGQISTPELCTTGTISAAGGRGGGGTHRQASITQTFSKVL